MAFNQEAHLEDVHAVFDKKYGMDINLFNGRKYIEKSNDIQGSPFWQSETKQKGRIVLKGKPYDNVFLLYDLYLQQFILEYTDNIGSQNRIVIDDRRIDTICIENSVFIPNDDNDIRNPFVELSYECDWFKCYFSWEVDKSFVTSGYNPGYYFSENKREVYLDKGTGPVRIKNRNNLIRMFDQVYQKQIRSIMRQNRFRVKKGTLADYQRIFTLIEGLKK